MAHVAALRALGDDLPVGVVVFVEGEEEYGSESLDRLITDHMECPRSDVIVIADSDNFDVGRPALTTSLRGLVSCFVEAHAHSAVHSGMFGGPVPDALTVLVCLLSTLHDDDGGVAVDGLAVRGGTTTDYPEERFRREAGVLDGSG
jgi:acetylornithine deacetylase/succinyl-diaminopimelate desuccinylase-like protein